MNVCDFFLHINRVIFNKEKDFLWKIDCKFSHFIASNLLWLHANEDDDGGGLEEKKYIMKVIFWAKNVSFIA